MDDFELELPDFDPQTAAETPVSDDFNLDIAPEGDMTAADTEQQRSEAEEFQRALAEALNTRRTPPAAAAYGNAADAEEDQGLPDVFGKPRRGSENTPRCHARQPAEVPASPMELPDEDAAQTANMPMKKPSHAIPADRDHGLAGNHRHPAAGWPARLFQPHAHCS
jgi:hypothetical protein